MSQNGNNAMEPAVDNAMTLEQVRADALAAWTAEQRQQALAKKAADGVRILGQGELTKKLDFKAHHFTKSALAKIEAKGGKAEVIPPPKRPVRNKMKPPKVKNGK